MKNILCQSWVFSEDEGDYFLLELPFGPTPPVGSLIAPGGGRPPARVRDILVDWRAGGRVVLFTDGDLHCPDPAYLVSQGWTPLPVEDSPIHDALDLLEFEGGEEAANQRKLDALDEHMRAQEFFALGANTGFEVGRKHGEAEASKHALQLLEAVKAGKEVSLNELDQAIQRLSAAREAHEGEDGLGDQAAQPDTAPSKGVH